MSLVAANRMSRTLRFDSMDPVRHWMWVSIAIGQSNWPVELDYTEVVLVVVELVEASAVSALSGRKAMRLDEIRH